MDRCCENCKESRDWAQPLWCVFNKRKVQPFAVCKYYKEKEKTEE